MPRPHRVWNPRRRCPRNTETGRTTRRETAEPSRMDGPVRRASQQTAGQATVRHMERRHRTRRPLPTEGPAGTLDRGGDPRRSPPRTMAFPAHVIGSPHPSGGRRGRSSRTGLAPGQPRSLSARAPRWRPARSSRAFLGRAAARQRVRRTAARGGGLRIERHLDAGGSNGDVALSLPASASASRAERSLPRAIEMARHRPSAIRSARQMRYWRPSWGSLVNRAPDSNRPASW
jgi:hypothetical protein